jgi:hypothetical protein
VSRDRFFWFAAGGLQLDQPVDIDAIAAAVRRVGPDLVWIDSGINAVSEAEEGTAVKRLFNNLSVLMREETLLGIGLSLHTRKRAQGSNDRRFDDLFGSREWKGRLGTLLYIEDTKIVSWKNRGGHLGRLWPKNAKGRPAAVLNRPGFTNAECAPFTIAVPVGGQEVGEAEIESKVRAMLGEEPGALTKTKLAESLGVRKKDALNVIKKLQDDGSVIPNQDGAKLSLAPVAVPGWGTVAED